MTLESRGGRASFSEPQTSVLQWLSVPSWLPAVRGFSAHVLWALASSLRPSVSLLLGLHEVTFLDSVPPEAVVGAQEGCPAAKPLAQSLGIFPILTAVPPRAGAWQDVVSETGALKWGEG